MIYQAVYLQTSASQLGYCMNKKFWANPKFADVAGYDASNVQAYLDQIERRCGLDALYPITGVTPIVQGKGQPEGGTRNWTYLTGEMRRRYGVNGEENLLVSVGSASPDTKNNGETYLDWLELPMREVLGGTDAKRPLLTVIDHNAGHHLAAPLAYRAFSRSTNEKPARILVNFDQHTDFGAPGSAGRHDKIRCSTWASFLTRSIAGVYPAPTIDAYVNFGAASVPGKGIDGNLGGGVVNYSKGAKLEPIGASVNVDDPVEVQVDLQLKKILADMQLGQGSAVEAYISVDRDFMSGSATPWGDGAQSPENGHAAVKAAFRFFSKIKANLMGADVCGLPARGYVVTKGPTPTPPAVLDQAYADIKLLADEMRQYDISESSAIAPR